MRRRGTLIVFAKAPRYGAAKTRLARGIGTLGAWRFYRVGLAALLRRLGRDRRWRRVLAVTPDRLAQPARFWPRRWRRVGQGPGDLGRRMARAMDGVAAGPVVLIGADIPAIGTAHIARAFAALQAADLVFGPAEDGGYWLVGARGRARRRRSLERLFAAVRWSTWAALADTLANQPPTWRHALVDRLADVDDAAALARARRGAKGRARTGRTRHRTKRK
ncbi:MAG: DUF2064 domain-containing protein [Alphaproteobacteria bacterium]|nr:DUF2064 domain-containing protein [Alphaproteobacteria bacterium]